MASTVTPRLRRSKVCSSGGGCSNQSTSPVCSAAEAVAASDRMRHSTRLNPATLPPAVRLGGASTGT